MSWNHIIAYKVLFLKVSSNQTYIEGWFFFFMMYILYYLVYMQVRLSKDIRGWVIDLIVHLRVRLFQCKIFFGCKIFLGENIFGKRKYFQVFGCIMKIILENIFKCLVAFWKCYFPTSFSHFLNHFLSFQTNFIIENFNI